ncbi:MAG: hypothetical protein V1856_03480 [Candidatus Liptonbacteria bacterium]
MPELTWIVMLVDLVLILLGVTVFLAGWLLFAAFYGVEIPCPRCQGVDHSRRTMRRDVFLCRNPGHPPVHYLRTGEEMGEEATGAK